MTGNRQAGDTFCHAEDTAARLEAELEDRLLEEIRTADVERVLDRLLEGRTGATRNRYRDLCSGMFKRAVRLGLVPTNPVTGIPKFRETGQRLAFLAPGEETAVRDSLPERLRPAFLVAVHTGLRFSEQAGLRWRDVDVMTNLITIELSKNGRRRRVPMNAAVRAALVDLASGRTRPNDPDEQLFPLSYRETQILSPRRSSGPGRCSGTRARTRADSTGVTWHTLPAHLRLAAHHGGRRPPDRGRARRLADVGDGPAVRAPQPRAPSGGRRADRGPRLGPSRSWTEVGLGRGHSRGVTGSCRLKSS